MVSPAEFISKQEIWKWLTILCIYGIGMKKKKNNMHELVLYFVFFFSYPIIECNESFALETKLEYPFSNEMVL